MNPGETEEHVANAEVAGGAFELQEAVKVDAIVERNEDDAVAGKRFWGRR